MYIAILLPLFLFCWIGNANAEIYTWTDGSGVVHFSDHPEPGAKTIEVQEIQTYSAPPSQPTSTLQPPPKGVKERATYSAINIVEPANQTTVRNPQGYVPVTVEVKPKLEDGDGLQLVLDGVVIGRPQQTSSFSLQGIERGSHQLVAQVVNEKGTVLTSSDPTTIFMMQPRVNTGPMNQVRPTQ
jgi:hypothetical protein